MQRQLTFLLVFVFAATVFFSHAVFVIRWEYEEYAAHEREIQSLTAVDRTAFDEVSRLISCGEDVTVYTAGCFNTDNRINALVREIGRETCQSIYAVSYTNGSVYYLCEYQEYIFVWSPFAEPDVSPVSGKSFRQYDMGGDMYLFAVK